MCGANARLALGCSTVVLAARGCAGGARMDRVGHRGAVVVGTGVEPNAVDRTLVLRDPRGAVEAFDLLRGTVIDGLLPSGQRCSATSAHAGVAQFYFLRWRRQDGHDPKIVHAAPQMSHGNDGTSRINLRTTRH